MHRSKGEMHEIYGPAGGTPDQMGYWDIYVKETTPDRAGDECHLLVHISGLPLR